jgi:hypothetical protein
MIMPYLETHSKTIALYTLLAYAHTHAHSRGWVGALLNLIARLEVRHV